MTLADQGDRVQVETLVQDMQQVTRGTVEMAYVDQGYTGPTVAEAAQSHGIRLEVSNPLWPNAAYCCRTGGLSSQASLGPLVATACARL